MFRDLVPHVRGANPELFHNFAWSKPGLFPIQYRLRAFSYWSSRCRCPGKAWKPSHKEMEAAQEEFGANGVWRRPALRPLKRITARGFCLAPTTRYNTSLGQRPRSSLEKIH